MQIPTFEALCLVPQGETFIVGEARYKPRVKQSKIRRRTISLPELSELATTQDTVVLVLRKGFGYAAKFGHIYLKLDRAKVRLAYVAEKQRRN